MRWLVCLAALAAASPRCSSDAPRPPPAPAISEDACVDDWLAQRGLDSYGNAGGTMYAGGTPLFDERSGQATDRLTYVYERQPGAKAACRK
jgi:hypothetical protein